MARFRHVAVSRAPKKIKQRKRTRLCGSGSSAKDVVSCSGKVFGNITRSSIEQYRSTMPLSTGSWESVHEAVLSDSEAPTDCATRSDVGNVDSCSLKPFEGVAVPENSQSFHDARHLPLEARHSSFGAHRGRSVASHPSQTTNQTQRFQLRCLFFLQLFYVLRVRSGIKPTKRPRCVEKMTFFCFWPRTDYATWSAVLETFDGRALVPFVRACCSEQLPVLSWCTGSTKGDQLQQPESPPRKASGELLTAPAPSRLRRRSFFVCPRARSTPRRSCPSTCTLLRNGSFWQLKVGGEW